MAFYSVLVKGKARGYRFPRRIALEATDRDHALRQAQEKCYGTPYEPNFDSIREITLARYNRIMGRLVGKAGNKDKPA